MNLRIHEHGECRVAEVVTDELALTSVQDALDLMVAAGDQGAQQLIVYEEQLAPEFFELSTGLAGEILQKFVNYQVKLAIVGDFSRRESRALQAFIRECNRGGPLSFVADLQAGLARLTE